MDFKVFKILLTAEVVLLFIQFWLGVSINLFVSIPLLSPFNFSSYSGGPEVVAHVVNGILVIALAALILIYGVRLKSIFTSALSTAALVFVIVASERGMAFALVGHDSTYSLEMAISFLVAYTIYLAMFYLAERMLPRK
jgi:hypothetical protein